MLLVERFVEGGDRAYERYQSQEDEKVIVDTAHGAGRLDVSWRSLDMASTGGRPVIATHPRQS